MNTQYLVKYVLYNYNLSTRHDLRKEKFDTLEYALEFYQELIDVFNSKDHSQYVHDKLHAFGFITKVLGVYKITEEKINV